MQSHSSGRRHGTLRDSGANDPHGSFQQIFGDSTELVYIHHYFIPSSDIYFLDLLASYNVSEQLSAIEDMIAQGADMETVVRLLCLASLTTGGIKTKVLDNIKREVLQVCISILRLRIH